MFAGLVALVVERVRALCVRGPLDVEPFVKAMRGSSREGARALMHGLRSTFVARAVAPVVDAPPEEIDVALEESLAETRADVVERLGAIRIAATLASFLGFVGAAIELQWIDSGDHGLLGLDPTRVQALGMRNAALSIALGVGGSSFALGSWAALRQHARRLVEDCDRAVERLRGGARG